MQLNNGNNGQSPCKGFITSVSANNLHRHITQDNFYGHSAAYVPHRENEIEFCAEFSAKRRSHAVSGR